MSNGKATAVIATAAFLGGLGLGVSINPTETTPTRLEGRVSSQSDRSLSSAEVFGAVESVMMASGFRWGGTASTIYEPPSGINTSRRRDTPLTETQLITWIAQNRRIPEEHVRLHYQAWDTHLYTHPGDDIYSVFFAHGDPQPYEIPNTKRPMMLQGWGISVD